MAYIDDEELQRLKQERPVTGNDTIDGYWLGYEAGVKAGVEQEKEQTSMYQGWYKEEASKLKAAEERVAELEGENARLKAKVRKLKKRAKGGC